MRFCSIALVLALAVSAEALRLNVGDSKNRPVTKVINLLKDMSAQLQKEQEEDEAVYNKLACWCTTNDKEKTQAIADAEAKISQLTSNIEEYSAGSARLNTEIKNLENEIAKNQKALDQATEIRKKELAEFNEEEKELLQSVTALKSAVVVLSKHHKPPTAALVDVTTVLRHAMHRHADMFNLLSTEQLSNVNAFMQQPQDYFDAKPAFKQSYAPQSGEIFGILQNMLDEFNANLTDSQKEELQKQKDFEDLKAAKEEEISQGQDHLSDKKQQLANMDESLAQAKEDIEDTRESLGADQRFLMDLKEKCQMTDNEWEQRQKSRQEEMGAVAEAISILSNDDAHDTFTKTFNPALFQKSSTTTVQEKAARLLQDAAVKYHNPALSSLATQVRLDAFTRVKKAIDDMIAELQKQKEDEIKHKDFCVDGLNTNDKDTALKNREKETLTSEIDTLKSNIETLAQEVKTLEGEIAELTTQLKRAGEDREKENKTFQSTVADQRATQKLLNQALGVLKNVYAKKAKASLLQANQPAGPPPPPGFKAYKKQGGAVGVISLLEQIIGDAKVMEAEAIQAETDAQKAYEMFVKDTNDSVTAKQDSIVNKQGEKAKKEKDLVQKERDHANTLTELEELANSAAALHKSCDFVLKNFEVRQTARDEEVEALRQAKAILSGAKFNELLQA